MKKIIFIVLFFSITIKAQSGSVFGKITDNKERVLIGANILVDGTVLGVATDSDGNYNLQGIINGTYKLTFSMVGYTKTTSQEIEIKNNRVEVNVSLVATSYQYDQLVVTANKFSQKLSDVAASTYIIDTKIFSKKNFQKLDDAFRYVPGVTMTLDQISIRGSSGYSRGAGTRVLITFDDIPIYTPDSGEIVWELIPVSEIGKVEIIKGSASSLYGSSAIGGVINIIPKEITSNPITFVKMQGGVYSKPSHKEWDWSDKTLYFNSQTISHSRSFGKLGISASVSRFEDLSYRQNEDQLRYSGYLKANYNFSESSTLSFIGAGFTRRRSTFIYWKNLENALSPSDDDLGQSIKSDRTILGMNFNHLFNKKLSLAIIPSLYLSYWDDESESNNKSNSNLFRTEVRINYTPTEKIIVVSGSEFQHNKVTSTIFGNRTSNGVGAYSQIDYKFIEPMNLSFGLRYDYNRLSNLESESSISPKLGITYKFNNSTFLRTSIAKGFRSPTLAESFTSTTTSGVTVKPNPNLKAENSFSIEAGIKHYFSTDFNADFALFNNEYFEFIEPGFDPKDGQLFFNNVTRARIQGFEVNAYSSFFSQSFLLNIGYTFLHSKDVDLNKELKYRPKHSIVTSFEYTKNIYEIGLDLRYSSKVKRIDNEIVDLGLVPDGDKRVEIFVLDARVGANLFSYKLPLRIFLNANNILNYNYVEIIGNIAPIRNYSLNLEFVF
ncbi:MAG: TonB-dependent receptor [Ignavibacteriae bacterium]|nr:TonB-dependent receptor [Ignavibacteriota bacterium]